MQLSPEAAREVTRWQREGVVRREGGSARLLLPPHSLALGVSVHLIGGGRGGAMEHAGPASPTHLRFFLGCLL